MSGILIFTLGSIAPQWAFTYQHNIMMSWKTTTENQKQNVKKKRFGMKVKIEMQMQILSFGIHLYCNYTYSKRYARSKCLVAWRKLTNAPELGITRIINGAKETHFMGVENVFDMQPIKEFACCLIEHCFRRISFSAAVEWSWFDFLMLLLNW